MHETMSRGDHIYSDGLSFISFILLILVVIFLAFFTLQIKIWLGYYKKNESELIPKVDEKPKRELNINDLKKLIIAELILINPKCDLENASLLLAEQDIETLRKLLDNLIQKRKKAANINKLIID